MIGDYTNTSAYLVSKAIVELYDGVPASSPLTISATPPTVAYRFRATVTSVTGHTDCAGTLFIGSDSLSFSASGQTKQCTTQMAANIKPTVSYSGLDCNILIECLDVGGQPIYTETLTPINVRLDPHQTAIQQENGTWIRLTDTAIITETALVVGNTIRINNTNYNIKHVDPVYDLGGEIDHYECTS